MLTSEDWMALVGVLSAFALGLALGVAGVAHSLRVAPHLEGTVSELVAIIARNVAVCGLLVVAARAPALRAWWPRQLVDVVAITVVLSAGFTAGLVASREGGHAHLPHAPLELPAVALSAAWWWRHRLRAPRRGTTGVRFAIVALTLTVAASIETFFVPHREAVHVPHPAGLLELPPAADLTRPARPLEFRKFDSRRR